LGICGGEALAARKAGLKDEPAVRQVAARKADLKDEHLRLSGGGP